MPARVLCILGEEEVRQRVKVALEREGFSVDVAGNGLDGITRAVAFPPDLVLAAAHLSDIEGQELAARLKGERSLERVPFVAMGAAPEDREAMLAAGADGFILWRSGGTLGDELRAFLAGKRERLPAEGERAQLRALSGAMAARLESAVAGERRASRRAEELNRLRTTFAHDLAHELSTPLTPLAGYLRIFASGKLGDLTPQQQRVLASMVTSVNRLTHILDNLADFASLEGSGPVLPHGEIEPDRLADDVVEELRTRAREARLHVEVRHSEGGAVAADPRKLRQALSNLVSNAVKFSPRGGEVLVEVSRDPTRVRFTVYDQGPGIRPGDGDLIFEPLYHAGTRADDARAPGSGLGLPVARRIAEAHGGRVYVESPPRTQPASVGHHYTGSKFVLEIPVSAREGPRAAGGGPPRRPPGGGPGGGMSPTQPGVH